jgi:hypothetical protein
MTPRFPTQLEDGINYFAPHQSLIFPLKLTFAFFEAKVPTYNQH